MNISAAPSYKRHRFPVESISHAVWRYFRFSLRYRDVEALLVERGIVVNYETIRQWAQQCGQQYANQLRRRRPQPGDTWHLDEVFLTINGKQHSLWRVLSTYSFGRYMHRVIAKMSGQITRYIIDLRPDDTG